VVSRADRLQLMRFFIFSVAFVCLAACGCNGSPEKPALVPVTGKVLLGDSALTAGSVMFTRETGEPKVFAIGPIDKHGVFELRTSGERGVPVGKYKVTVFASRPGAINKNSPIPVKYGSPEATPLVIEVTENASAGAFDLKLSRN